MFIPLISVFTIYSVFNVLVRHGVLTIKIDTSSTIPRLQCKLNQRNTIQRKQKTKNKKKSNKIKTKLNQHIQPLTPPHENHTFLTLILAKRAKGSFVVINAN